MHIVSHVEMLHGEVGWSLGKGQIYYEKEMLL